MLSQQQHTTLVYHLTRVENARKEFESKASAAMINNMTSESGNNHLHEWAMGLTDLEMAIKRLEEILRKEAP